MQLLWKGLWIVGDSGPGWEGTEELPNTPHGYFNVRQENWLNRRRAVFNPLNVGTVWRERLEGALGRWFKMDFTAI